MLTVNNGYTMVVRMVGKNLEIPGGARVIGTRINNFALL
jgi:hypothetical protein